MNPMVKRELAETIRKVTYLLLALSTNPENAKAMISVGRTVIELPTNKGSRK